MADSKLTLKEQELMDPYDGNDSDDMDNKPDVEQQRLAKAAFLDAAGDDSDDDFLTKWEKTEKELAQEAREMEEARKLQERERINGTKVLQRFWSEKADAKIDDTDKFLWDYILNEKWKEKNNSVDEDKDREDEEWSEEMNDFDREHNYRFEEPGGCELKTYPWVIEDSVRVKKSRWADQRENKKERIIK